VAPFPIMDCPTDVLTVIFYWLELVDLFAIACVCRRFNTIVHNDKLKLIVRVSKRNAITWRIDRREIRPYTDDTVGDHYNTTYKMHIYSKCVACGTDDYRGEQYCIYICSMCKLTLCCKILPTYLSTAGEEICKECHMSQNQK
jgi:hypothetical protein